MLSCRRKPTCALEYRKLAPFALDQLAAPRRIVQVRIGLDKRLHESIVPLLKAYRSEERELLIKHNREGGARVEENDGEDA